MFDLHLIIRIATVAILKKLKDRRDKFTYVCDKFTLYFLYYITL